jgi:hypothetical protein
MGEGECGSRLSRSGLVRAINGGAGLAMARPTAKVAVHVETARGQFSNDWTGRQGVSEANDCLFFPSGSEYQSMEAPLKR